MFLLDEKKISLTSNTYKTCRFSLLICCFTISLSSTLNQMIPHLYTGALKIKWRGRNYLHLSTWNNISICTGILFMSTIHFQNKEWKKLVVIVSLCGDKCLMRELLVSWTSQVRGQNRISAASQQGFWFPTEIRQCPNVSCVPVCISWLWNVVA